MGRPQVLRQIPWLATAWQIIPLRGLWWLFSNIRWAVALMVFIALVGLLGVILPQIPFSVRDDPVAEVAWVELQRGKFGPATDWMHRVGLFDIFHARWFIVSLGLMVASTTVYILGRLPSLWSSVVRPRKRVPDRYFQVAPHRFAFPTPGDSLALEVVLRRQRYQVERFSEREAIYLFADRFPWAQFSTILTHAAVVLFILAAVMSRASGFSTPLFIPEEGTAPVFPSLARADQMQVQLLDTLGRFDEKGRPLDYRSQLALYQHGAEVKRCITTVNSPCQYNGYRFSQAAYYGFGAEVQVRDVLTGNTVYRETLALWDKRPAPHLIIRETASDRLLFNDTPILGDLVRTETEAGPVEAALARITLPEDGRSLVIGLRHTVGEQDWTLLALDDTNPQGVRLQLSEGQNAEAGGLAFQFVRLKQLPASQEQDFPVPPILQASVQPSGVLLQLANVVYGTGNASEGSSLDIPATSAPAVLSILGVAPEPLVLRSGQSARVAEYEYTFLGQREFAGIQVKKDPSDNLIWVATGLLLGGLLVSFWVPRRRLWAKITPTWTYLVGQTGQFANLQREMRQLALRAGASLKEEEGQEEDA